MRATLAGRALPDTPCRSSFLLRGNTTSVATAESFRKHWSGIMTEPACPGARRPFTQSPPQVTGERLDEETHAHTEQVKFALEDLVHVIGKLKMGRAGGDDGVAAEFIRALPAGAKTRLWVFIRGLLLGKIPVPPGWHQANVALIPKIAAAFHPGDVRTIIVLPVCLKLTMRAWLCAASPYLELRRPPSHGFRATWQPAEARFVLRELLCKHAEWDSATDTCKI